MFGSKKKKDLAFFGAFSEHAAQSVAASKMLVEMFTHLQVAPGEEAPFRGASLEAAEEPDELTRALVERIKQAEVEGDTITHQTMKRLHENWITPLDRDDIHGLISRMDDVLDCIEEAADRVALFQIRAAPREAAELSAVLVRSCEAVARAVALLPRMTNAPAILELCVEVNRLENEADAVYRRGMAALYRPGNDPLMVMKWHDIFGNLEAATDRCEDVANIVEGVVLEYA